MKPSVAFNPERDSSEAAMFVYTFFYQAVHRGVSELISDILAEGYSKGDSVKSFRFIALPAVENVWKVGPVSENDKEIEPVRDNYTDSDAYDEACYRASSLSRKHVYQKRAAASVLNDCEDVDLLFENVLSLIEKKEYQYICYAVMSGCSHMFDSFSNDDLFRCFKADDIRGLLNEDVQINEDVKNKINEDIKISGINPDSERGKKIREHSLRIRKSRLKKDNKYKQYLIDVAKSLGIDQDDDFAAKLNNIINTRKEEFLGKAAIYWEIDQDIESNNEEYVGMLKKHNLEYLLSRNEVLAHRESCSKQEEEKALKSARESIKSSSKNKSSSSGCFVATAVLNNPFHPSLIALREFRDECLLKSRNGERFVYWYYRNGPVLAKYISGKAFLRIVTKYLFVIPVSIVAKIILFVISNRHYKH